MCEHPYPDAFCCEALNGNLLEASLVHHCHKTSHWQVSKQVLDGSQVRTSVKQRMMQQIWYAEMGL